jgi:putative transposase
MFRSGNRRSGLMCSQPVVTNGPDHPDNGEEFHSKTFERGAAEYRIRLTCRPRAPQVGGHIGRLICTFMHRIHPIPGRTFSNVADKGRYS